MFLLSLTCNFFSICEDQAGVNLFHLCSKKQDSREVYHLLLRDIESKCSNKEAKQRFKLILQVFLTVTVKQIALCEVVFAQAESNCDSNSLI